MQLSNVIDEDGQVFPDPLINHNIGALTKIPTEYQITSRDLSRFWTMMWEQYGLNELDDLLLNINGIKYIMDLKPGDTIYKVDPNDLEGFYRNKIKGYED